MADNKVVLEFELQGNAPEKTQSLMTQMRQLREELARLPEGTAEYNKVQRQLGELTDKVGDLSKSVNTLAGDPLERLNNSFGMIGSSILSLDFGAAQTGLQGVTSAIKDFKFGDLTKAAKGFGSTMMDLGKALLTNPIFLIGGIIALIVANFEALTEAGGLVGRMFGFLKTTIDSVTQGLVDFMDWIGLTDSKAAERAENDKKRAEENKKLKDEELKKAKEVEEQKEKLAKEAAEKEAQRIQKIKDDQKSLTEFLKGENEKRYQNFLTNREKELRQLQLTYDEKKRLAHGDKELLMQLDNEYNAQRLGVESKYFTASKDIKKTADKEDIKIKTDNLRSTIQFANDEQLVEYESAENQKEIAKSLYESRFMLAQASVNALMDLNSFLTDSGLINAKKSFQINKALGIAQASIATYEGATNAFTTAAASPITIGFPGYPALMAGLAVTAGLAKVAKIASTKFNPSGGASAPSGGGGGGGGAMGGMGGGGGSTSAPALDLSFLNNGQTKAQPIQSYVLATNVTSAQDAQQKILDQSKLIK
jgi:hypothetical protein